MEDNKELSNEQFGAITRSIKLGRTLQKDHPEIAVIYGYYSQRDIPEMLDIQSKYGVSDDIALTGVSKSILGHEGSFGIESYVGLITDEEELKRLREGRKVAGVLKGGQTTYEQGIGVHGRTAEQIIEDGRKGGRKGGQTTYEQGIGIHGRTAEQIIEASRKGNIAQGNTPWSDEEKEFNYLLSLESEYQHPKGDYSPGKPNNELIAFALNIEYHDCKEVRSTNAIGTQLSRYRKSLVDVVA